MTAINCRNMTLDWAKVPSGCSQRLGSGCDRVSTTGFPPSGEEFSESAERALRTRSLRGLAPHRPDSMLRCAGESQRLLRASRSGRSIPQAPRTRTDCGASLSPSHDREDRWERGPVHHGHVFYEHLRRGSVPPKRLFPYRDSAQEHIRVGRTSAAVIRREPKSAGRQTARLGP